ncbi:hypothetical protein Athai_36970 [Actinocatenispora thailandica]|uniref:Uncharacterized protein n=1 Tax=Actinocatenispora thailandica TaxID=227318 RepID=A0A7R7DR02_9ACTN|nr:hypothetical protein [Actinocatenispora thailandica]BCJ36194.1 hypothetical protein Athai_36970 [Actinocatenispora thailandica]
MGDTTSGTSDSSDGGDLKHLGALVTVIGGVVSVLVGINALTGWNPLRSVLAGASPSATPSTTWSPVDDHPSRDTGYVPPADPVEPADSPSPDEPEDSPTPSPSPAEAAPLFTVYSEDWGGRCDPGCPMRAVFQNRGGAAGTATATFYVLPFDDRQHYLAYCSVVLPRTAHGDQAGAGCTAYTATLGQWFRANPGGRVAMQVSVHNPAS